MTAILHVSQPVCRWFSVPRPPSSLTYSISTSSQKPGDAFIANFRQAFPEARVRSSLSDDAVPDAPAAAPNASVSESVAAPPATDVVKDPDQTPKALNESFRFTPSLLDVNAFNFPAFAPGFTPTPGGMHTLYHPQAGDLHTPNLGLSLGLGTPLSMPTSADGLHITSLLDMSAFTHQMPHSFANYDPFAQNLAQAPNVRPALHAQPTGFAPSSFLHQDTGYETMEHDGSPISDDEPKMASIDATLQPSYDHSMAAPASQQTEKFRFHVILNAPTAMIKHADEIPITYLNKGQAYSLTIIDQEPHTPRAPDTVLRTVIRVSFEDEQQRSKPATCWQLWKEGRGTNEAHQRGGKLQAVEYVESTHATETDARARVNLDTASFDGFSVTWTPSAQGRAECTLAVRFNFLSTDFSHSKGVKGIPVRLCAKTSVVTTGSPRSVPHYAELVYCKVKLFRDHGAERKLSNDVAHVRKTIDKLKHQIAQAEAGLKDFGKRKRAGSSVKVPTVERPGKVMKHKRTWSMSSASSSGGGGKAHTAEDDLHCKLRTMQDMFTSTRPASVFFLRGQALDDPDLHPVVLAGEPLNLAKTEVEGSVASPSPSQGSLPSQLHSAMSTTAPWADIKTSPAMVTAQRVPKLGVPEGWIDATGIDAHYTPPVERAIKPVACFYVRKRDGPVDASDPSTYHRAIYLMERRLETFTAAIQQKWALPAGAHVRTLHVLERGLEVEMDDDVIRELGEGQDMELEVSGGASTAGYEFRLFF